MHKESGVPKVINWGGQKDLASNSDRLELRNEVFNEIKSCDGDLSQGRDETLDPQNVFFPQVKGIDTETTKVLASIGIPLGLSVIFIKDKRSKIGQNTVEVTGKLDEQGLGASSLYFNLDRLLPPDVLNHSNTLRFNCMGKNLTGNVFYSESSKPLYGLGKFSFGAFSQGEEKLLVIKELISSRGYRTFKLDSVALPKGWLKVVENGRLIGDSEKEQGGNKDEPELTLHYIDPNSLRNHTQTQNIAAGTTSSENLAETPESKLQNEVIERIENRLKESGLVKETEKLDPRYVSIPTISMGREKDVFWTQRVLERIGLPKGFSAIFVREKDGQEEETISVSGWQPNENMYCLDLTTANGSMISPAFIFKNMTNPSVFEVGHSNKEIRLGNISPTEERVLLIRGHYGGRWEVSSLALPQGWRSVFDEGGRLKEPELIRRAKTEIEQLFRQTQGVTGMTQNTILEEKKPTEQLPQLTFAQILAKVKTFPFYRGPAEGKEGIRTAIFGKAKTPAEIKVLDNDILKNGARVSFKFCAFNGNKLEDVFKRNRRVHDRLTLEAFASCFIPGFESKDNLVLKLSLDTTGQTKLEGNLVRWDIGKGGEVDSFPYLRSNLESHELDEIRKIMNDKNVTLSFFFSQLETAEDQAKKTSVGEMIEEMRFLRRTAGRDSWKTDFGMSGGYTGGDDFYRERRSGNGVKNIEGLLRDETPFPENARSQYIGKPAPSFKDRDPEKRKEESRKYWAHKAERRNRKSKNLGKSKKRK